MPNVGTLLFKDDMKCFAFRLTEIYLFALFGENVKSNGQEELIAGSTECRNALRLQLMNNAVVDIFSIGCVLFYVSVLRALITLHTTKSTDPIEHNTECAS